MESWIFVPFQVRPTEILLSGGSAGGMAAFLKCDFAAARLAPQGIPVKCLPDAGVFPQLNYDWVADNMHAREGLPAACVKPPSRNSRQSRASEGGRKGW